MPRKAAERGEETESRRRDALALCDSDASSHLFEKSTDAFEN
jgi:hypothetical protein